MSANFTGPSPQVNDVSGLPRTSQPPTEEAVEWFTNAVWPALKELADSDLFDFSYLREAAQTLPDADQPAWLDLVRRLQITAGKAMGFGHPDHSFPVRFFKTAWTLLRLSFRPEIQPTQENVFRKLVRDLNTNWFIPRSLFLYPWTQLQMPTFSGPQLWDFAGVALAEIVQAQVFRFADGVVNAYTVCHMLPQLVHVERHPCFYDPVTRMVVIDAARTTMRGLEIRLGARGDADLERYLLLGRRWELKCLATDRRYCQRLDHRYPDMEDLGFHFFRRVLAEELRHAMDGIRADLHMQGDVCLRRWGEMLLSRNGRVRQEFWEPVQSGESKTLLHGESVNAGMVVNELSGQMTAAAVADPAMVLLEWWHKWALLASHPSDAWYSRRKLRQNPDHTLAGILGTVLLDERLNGRAPLSWSMLGQPNFALLADCAWQLANRPAAELRLALKAIYQSEFTYPIDEPPFAEILGTGELRDRLEAKRS